VFGAFDVFHVNLVQNVRVVAGVILWIVIVGREPTPVDDVTRRNVGVRVTAPTPIVCSCRNFC
jgi:hypothetical protein